LNRRTGVAPLAWLGALLVVLLVTACGPFSSSGEAPPPAGADGTLTTADVLQAQDILLRRFVDPLDPKALLRVAWEGALDRAEDDRVDVRDVSTPDLPDALDEETTNQRFRDAFEELITASARKVSADSLVRAAITGMTDSLNDSHTRFVPPESWATTSRLGPEFLYRTIRTETGVMVWDVTEGSNADRAGVRPGDVIEKINGVSPLDRERPPDVSLDQASTLELSRSGAPKRSVRVEPEPQTSAPFEARMIGNVAYVMLYSFLPRDHELEGGVQFQEAFVTAVNDLAAKNPSGWVLDLRNCPGGNINSIGFVSGLFGAQGIVYQAKQRAGTERIVWASETDVVRGRPLVVLTNSASASAAEITTASLQDAGLGYVIGTHTAKKVNGSLRYTLEGGGGLVVTIERTRAGPLERVLEGTGVAPDELVPLDLVGIALGRDNQLSRALTYLQNEVAGHRP
jgi:carboxyl-terminal processing protease